MSWWRPNEVRITHLPSGHVVRAEKPNGGLYRLREIAMRMLRAKLAAPVNYGPPRLVRCYEMPEGAWTTPELDGNVYINPVR
jgi:hypothetical protein